MASTKLSVSTTSSGTRTKWTISFWVKRSNLSNENCVVGSHLDSSNKDKIAFHTDGKLSWGSFQAGSYTNMGNLITSRVFRDVNAWYHIVCRWDTNNSTADDRMKIWVNGVEETSFSTRINPELNRVSLINYTTYTTIGNNGASGNYFDGSLSHVHFCDNYAYSASDFGETDSTTGEWKIKTSPSVSYGTNGFFILKDGNSLTDQSPNTNNLTLSSGTLTKTEDNPSNIFATFNPLCARTQIVGSSNVSYTNGNNTVTNTDTSYSSYNVSTLGMQGSGKYYCEFKLNTLGGSSDSERFGISNLNNFSNYPFGSSSGYSYNKDGNATPSGSGFPTYSTNDIIGVAFDAGNGNMWFSKNGTWINSATISEIAAGTTTNAVFTGISTSETWHFSGATYSNGSISANFGNGYFGTTAVASAGTNASNNGIFEYDVPSGYTALSTKGLNT